MSNFNYLVKETPFSAYITIHKTFVKDIENLDKLENESRPSNLEVEINALRESNKDLLTKLEMARVDFEEKEVEKETIISKLSKKDEELEQLLKNERMLNEEVNAPNIEKVELKSTIDQISKEKNEHLDKIEEMDSHNVNLKKELEKSKKKFKDLEMVNTELEKIS